MKTYSIISRFACLGAVLAATSIAALLWLAGFEIKRGLALAAAVVMLVFSTLLGGFLGALAGAWLVGGRPPGPPRC